MQLEPLEPTNIEADNRKPVAHMTERELLEELVYEQREFISAARKFIDQFSNSPVLKAFMS